MYHASEDPGLTLWGSFGEHRGVPGAKQTDQHELFWELGSLPDTNDTWALTIGLE